MPISPLPLYSGTPPNRSQSQAEFNDNIADWVSYTTTFQPAFNTFATEFQSEGNSYIASLSAISASAISATDLNKAQALSYATQAGAHASAAGAYASSALSYKDTAAALAGFKGRWSSLSGAVNIPASVYHKGLFWVLASNTSDVTTIEPGVSSQWLLEPSVSFSRMRESVLSRAVLSLDFSKNRHSVYEQFGNEPKQLLSAVNFSRSTTTEYYSPNGLKTALVNVPGISFNPLTGEPQGYFPQRASTNLVLRNQEMNDAAWNTKVRCSVTANTAVSIDGTTTADLVYHNESANTDWYIGQSGSVTSGLTYCSSVYFKPSPLCTSSISAYLSGTGFGGTNIAVAWDRSADAAVVISGAPLYYGLEKLANGWRRIWVSATASTTGSITNLGLYWARLGTIGTYTATADPIGEGYYLTLPQVEEGITPTSPIKTAASTVTRNASSMIRDITDIANPNAFALYAEFITHAAGNLQRIVVIGDTTSTNECSINFGSNTSAGRIVGQIRAAGVSSLLDTMLQTTAGQRCKAVLRCVLRNGLYEWSLCVNGGNISNIVTTTALPSGWDKLSIGRRNYTSNTLQADCPINYAAYISGELTDADMQVLTT